MEIRRLTGGLGAEIIGADICNPEMFPAIKEAFVEHSVIVIRDQSLTPDDHLAFARRFGPVNVNRFFNSLDTHPEIAIVVKEADQTAAVGEAWHTDHAYDEQPAMGSILHGIEIPPFGGDTVFVSMSRAYESLTPGFQRLLTGLKAWHSSRHVFGQSQTDSESAQTGRIRNSDKATQDVLHPIVIRHPLSGRKGLFVNPQFTTRIDGFSKQESDAMLTLLFQHCQQPEFQCRVTWRAGDVTMWDNRATWHKAINDYHGHRRYMHRVTVEGCALEVA